MYKIFLSILLVITVNFSCFSQPRVAESPYEVNEALEIPLALIGAGVTAYGFYEISKKSSSDSATVVNLSLEEEVIKMNRKHQPRYSEQANKDSDIFFYGSFPLPFLLLLDDNIRRDAGRISIMYIEALGLTGTMYSMTAANVNKYRPLVYSDEAPMSERTSSGAKNSFFGGHPSLTATSTFFAAKVFTDYYPERKGMHVLLYSAATMATLGNAYLRFKAGKHFLTDLMIGVPLGALNGILIPQLHKVRDVNMDKNLSWNVFTGHAHGLTLKYKF